MSDQRGDDHVMDVLLDEVARGPAPPDLTERITEAADHEALIEPTAGLPRRGGTARLIAAAAVLFIAMAVFLTARTTPPPATEEAVAEPPPKEEVAPRPSDEKKPKEKPEVPEEKRFVDTTYWRLDLEPLGYRALDKTRIKGTLYHYFSYEIANNGKKARKVDIQISLLVDRLRTGVSRDDVKAFDGFRNHRLPKVPDSDTTEFDNTKKYQLLKRYFDREHAAARKAILRKLGGKLTRAGKIGTLQPGAKARGLAVFSDIDPNTDYCAVVVKGLVNRITDVGDKRFMEDRFLLVPYWTPGAASNVDQNPIVYRGPPRWRIMKREKITYPMK